LPRMAAVGRGNRLYSFGICRRHFNCYFNLAPWALAQSKKHIKTKGTN